MFISLLALLPVGFVITAGIETGWKIAKALIFRPRVAELLSNTFWLILLAIPAFVQSYAWVSVIPSMHGLSAVVFLSILAYYPFIYMPVAAVLRRLDPNLEDVAASLGVPPWRIFFRVVLPQLRLAIWGGALLVAIHLLAEYGLYVMVRFDTFTTAIYDQFQSSFSGPAASMLAGVLALCCLLLLTLEGLSRGSARYSRVGSGSARAQQRASPGYFSHGLGQILMRGESLFDGGKAVPAYLRKIGYVPQEGALFPHLRVEENIAWGIEGSRHEKRKRVDALMEKVSLDRQLGRHWPHEISGGQQQRVALARALAQQPSLMLLDEPFSALDTGLRAATRRATADLLSQAGVASILVTHDQNEALSFASQVVDIDFAGFLSTLTLCFTDNNQTLTVTSVTQPGLLAGTMVDVHIMGNARVFSG